ncbi:hypothetical protein SBY92_004566 [Candida maltosa Xu316]
MLRCLRFNSSIAMSHFLESPITPVSVQKIIPHFIDLSLQEQDALIEKHPKLKTVQLQIMLYSETSAVKIFKYIFNNSQFIQSEFIEIFIYNLLEKDNLKATTTLLHKLLSDNCQISNELWSVFLDKVCRSGDYLGAMLAYHHLLDNITYYNEVSYLTQLNDRIPFLLTTKNLEALALIFKNNGDSLRVSGVLQYFRRFYSLHQYQFIYKSLLICEIELFAEQGDFHKSLMLFKQFCYAHNRSDIQGNKVVGGVWENITLRNDNIRNNTNSITYPESKYNLDIHQSLVGKICQTDLFNPLAHRNVYSSAKGGINPVINGSVNRLDLPMFENLLTEKIATMEMRDILHITKMSHRSLGIFVVSAFCSLGQLQNALSYLKTLPHIFSQILPKHLVKNQSIVRILDCITDIELANEVMKFYRSVHGDYIDAKVLKAYISVLLSSDKTSSSEIMTQMRTLEQLKNNHLTLTIDQYRKLQILTNNSTYDFILVNTT